MTGGPCAGKTTLLEALRRKGFATLPEAGRAIIRDQVAIGGRALPWADPELFAEAMLTHDLRSYRLAAELPGPVLCDRGVVDVVGWYLLLGRPVPAHVTAAAERFRYHRRALVAPPWPEIYELDEERTQSLGEAERTYDAQVAAYTMHGYELVELPRVPVEERVRFVEGFTGSG